MRRIDVLVDALCELTGRDREAVAQTFSAILAASPDKAADLEAEITFAEASAMRERLLKEGPHVLARMVEKMQ